MCSTARNAAAALRATALIMHEKPRVVSRNLVFREARYFIFRENIHGRGELVPSLFGHSRWKPLNFSNPDCGMICLILHFVSNLLVC